MKIQIVVTIGFIIAVYCLFKFQHILKTARSNLSDHELRLVEKYVSFDFIETIFPVSPLLISYFIQDHVPIHPYLTVLTAGAITFVLIWMQELKKLDKIKAEGVSSIYASKHIKASIVLWFGVVVFVITYVLTKLGWVI